MKVETHAIELNSLLARLNALNKDQRMRLFRSESQFEDAVCSVKIALSMFPERMSVAVVSSEMADWGNEVGAMLNNAFNMKTSGLNMPGLHLIPLFLVLAYNHEIPDIMDYHLSQLTQRSHKENLISAAKSGTIYLGVQHLSPDSEKLSLLNAWAKNAQFLLNKNSVRLQTKLDYRCSKLSHRFST